MRISYQMTPGEYVAAQMLNYRSSIQGVILLTIYWIAVPAFGLFMLIGAGSIARSSGYTLSSLSGLIAPALFLLMPLWLHLYFRHRFRSTRISDSACCFDFEDQNITTEMPGFSKSTVEWAAVKKYRTSKKMLLIYLSRASFLVIPVRALAASEYEELIAILRRKKSSSQHLAA
jgi:hypothetical protein